MLGIFIFWGIELHDFAAEFALGWWRRLNDTIVRDLTDVVLNSA
jgi:hypothetical protein